jgi:hypothetical protein
MMDSPGCFPIRVPTSEGRVANCKAQVRVLGAATYVVVEEESAAHPSCLLVNALPQGWALEAHQHRCTPSGALVVAAGSSQIVCWDEPHMPHLLQLRAVRKAAATCGGEEVGGERIVDMLVDVDDLGAEVSGSDEVSVHVVAHGPTQVVRVAAAARDGGGHAGRETLDGAAHIEKIMAPDVELVRWSVTLQLAGAGLAVLDGAVSEVLYLSATGVRANYLLGTSEASWEWKVASLQIDNQTDVGGAVVLQPRQPLGKGGGGGDGAPAAGDLPPMLHVCVIRQLDRQLDWFRYLAVSLQELRLAMHESVVLRCLEILQAVVNSSNGLSSAARGPGQTGASHLCSRLFNIDDSDNDEEWWRLVEDLGGGGGQRPARSADAGAVGTDAHRPGGGRGSKVMTERRVYVETMHLHPVLLHLQFTPTGEVRSWDWWPGLEAGRL